MSRLDPAGRTPEPAAGPDEEGEVPLDPDAIRKDRAAWVNDAPAAREGPAAPESDRRDDA